MFIRFDMIHEREKNRRFHVSQPTFLFPLETPLRLSRNMLHGWKDNSTLAKPLAAWTYIYLQQFRVKRCLSQRVSPKIAIFTTFFPRDAMHKRGLCCHAVSIRLCPSVTFVDHVKTNKHILEFFAPSGSDTILVFPYQRGCRYSDGNPPNEGVECKWV